MLHHAEGNRLVTAGELLVTAIVLGEVLLERRNIRINTQLVGVPAGNEIWSSSIEGPIGEAVELQQRLLKQLVGAVAPGLDPDPVMGSRAEAGDCSSVYEIYLRGKQLSTARKQSQAELYNKGMELLREAVTLDDKCALAWEAIAMASVDWSLPGFVKAGAAARRALELNDALPGAWSVLAEIAEQEKDWMGSEEYFLRALYADPTNAHTNQFYGESLLARGRVREGLHHMLEAYRYDPASVTINNHVGIAAVRTGDGDIAIKHAEIFGELLGRPGHSWVQGLLAEGYLLTGDINKALEAYAEIGFEAGHWYPQCASLREHPDLAPRVIEGMNETLDKYMSGTMGEAELYIIGYALVRCGTWLGQVDVVFDVLDAKGVPPFEDGPPTEVIFLNLFYPDAAILRSDPRFRQLVEETGLLEYWRKWGWSDFCRPDGDSFVCD
jgi:tetratricopeptide (TPR) repeat protein